MMIEQARRAVERIAALVYWLGALLVTIGIGSRYGFDAATISVGAALIGFVLMNKG